ncbi:hypothetical protein T439DRAFT_378649 [Meredithblackwellia eburnea MCA 4105]
MGSISTSRRSPASVVQTTDTTPAASPTFPDPGSEYTSLKPSRSCIKKAQLGLGTPPSRTAGRTVDDDSRKRKSSGTAARSASKSAKRPEGHTPRPPNAWILYRSEQIRALKSDKELSKKPQSDISKLIGHMWREESDEVKRWYETEAELRKREHKIKYPDYRFCPVRKGKSTESGHASPATAASPSSSTSAVVDNVNISTQQATIPEEASLIRPQLSSHQAFDPSYHGASCHPLPAVPHSAPLESTSHTGWPHDNYGPFISVFENTFIHPSHHQQGKLPLTACAEWEYEVRSPEWYPPHSAPATTSHFHHDFQPQPHDECLSPAALSPYHTASSYVGSVHDFFFDDSLTDHELPSPASTVPDSGLASPTSFAPGPCAAGADGLPAAENGYFQQYQYPTVLSKPQYFQQPSHVLSAPFLPVSASDSCLGLYLHSQ